MILTVKIADKTIELDVIHPELKGFFKDYLVPYQAPDLVLSCTREDVLAEQDILSETSFPESYLETLAILRKIAEFFPGHNRLLIHGASISYQNKAYLFCAPSGTGKSTHIRLWREYLGADVGIVNGDKPFISLENDKPIIYGTPWAGKENWQRNCSAQLDGICFIQRGTINRIRKVEPSEIIPLLFKQVYLPKDPVAAGQTLELADILTKKVPLYILECDISEDAVRCSFETMTGLPYK